jgi:hypothetical protein
LRRLTNVDSYTPVDSETPVREYWVASDPRSKSDAPGDDPNRDERGVVEVGDAPGADLNAAATGRAVRDHQVDWLALELPQSRCTVNKPRLTTSG